MRSIAGVGMTPPKVLGAPNPWSSVMISSTLGAPFGGTTRGAHHGVDSDAFCLITPPNFGLGIGTCFPSRVVVAPGEPGAGDCWANVGNVLTAAKVTSTKTVTDLRSAYMLFSPLMRKPRPGAALTRRLGPNTVNP